MAVILAIIAFAIAVLIVCVANIINTSIVSNTLRSLPADKAKYYSSILENTNKDLPSVGLNVKTEVTYEQQTKQ